MGGLLSGVGGGLRGRAATKGGKFGTEGDPRYSMDWNPTFTARFNVLS